MYSGDGLTHLIIHPLCYLKLYTKNHLTTGYIYFNLFKKEMKNMKKKRFKLMKHKYHKLISRVNLLLILIINRKCCHKHFKHSDIPCGLIDDAPIHFLLKILTKKIVAINQLCQTVHALQIAGWGAFKMCACY